MSGTPEPRVYRVVIADDSYLIRESLRPVLEGEEAVQVVAYASSLPTLLQEVSGAVVAISPPRCFDSGDKLPWCSVLLSPVAGDRARHAPAAAAAIARD